MYHTYADTIVGCCDTFVYVTKFNRKVCKHFTSSKYFVDLVHVSSCWNYMWPKWSRLHRIFNTSVLNLTTTCIILHHV